MNIHLIGNKLPSNPLTGTGVIKLHVEKWNLYLTLSFVSPDQHKPAQKFSDQLTRLSPPPSQGIFQSGNAAGARRFSKSKPSRVHGAELRPNAFQMVLPSLSVSLLMVTRAGNDSASCPLKTTEEDGVGGVTESDNERWCFKCGCSSFIRSGWPAILFFPAGQGGRQLLSIGGQMLHQQPTEHFFETNNSQRRTSSFLDKISFRRQLSCIITSHEFKCKASLRSLEPKNKK